MQKIFKAVPLVSGHKKNVDKIGDPYFEQIVLYDGEYPFAMVHIDAFHTKGGNQIYDKSNSGKTVMVKFTLEIAEP